MSVLSLGRLTRWRLSRSGFASSSRLRDEVKPPSLRCAPASGWQRLKFWVLAPSPAEAAPPLSQLPKVRADFLACLDDTTGDEAAALTLRIERSKSLRELWHLRTSLFGCLARQFSQTEAQVRVKGLARHFDPAACAGTCRACHESQPVRSRLPACPRTGSPALAARRAFVDLNQASCSRPPACRATAGSG